MIKWSCVWYNISWERIRI